MGQRGLERGALPASGSGASSGSATLERTRSCFLSVGHSTSSPPLPGGAPPLSRTPAFSSWPGSPAHWLLFHPSWPCPQVGAVTGFLWSLQCFFLQIKANITPVPTPKGSGCHTLLASPRVPAPLARTLLGPPRPSPRCLHSVLQGGVPWCHQGPTLCRAVEKSPAGAL